MNYLSHYSAWDWLWEPTPWQAHQRHAWPSQWQRDSGTYLVPRSGYVDTNYKTDGIIRRLPDPTAWHVPDHIDPDSIDFSWHPDPTEPPYIYHFPSQWQSASGTTYSSPGARDIKILHATEAFRVRALSDKSRWHVPDHIDPDSIDFSWHPNALSPPSNYMFETKWHWHRIGGPEYRMAGAVDIDYLSDLVVDTKSDPSRWYVPEWIDPDSIDRTWVPNPADPPYIYEFPVEWGWNSIGGPEYRVFGATERKYATDFQARTRPDPDNFTVSDRLATDDPVMRWRPNPVEPPYIYIFGNQWHSAEIRESARYSVPGASQKKYITELACTRLPDQTRFEFLYPSMFDCSWEPDPGSPPYIYVFGNQYYPAEVMPTVRYAMPGANEVKFMEVQAQLLPDTTGPWQILQTCEWDYTWRPEPGSPAYIYVFGNQWWPAEKMPTVEYHMPGATERKYMVGPVAHLPIDMTNWHVPAGVDAKDMDFSWVPDPGEPPYIYQFATQHQKTGGPEYRVPGATEIKYMDMMRAAVTTEAAPIFEIDHMDGHAGQIANTVRRIRYFDNYRDTLIRLARSLEGEHEHVWVCSSICDYTDFDFSWHPETWQSTMLHVFASDDQKFGDTFLMHVPSFADRAEQKALLEWTAVNFVPGRSVPRRAIPVIVHDQDTHVDQVRAWSGSEPVAVFADRDPGLKRWPAVNLWRPETKTVIPLDAAAGVVVVPKTAVPYIKTQIYDYPYIDKSCRGWMQNRPLDIVFISNGESNADSNYQHLLWVLGQPNHNRVHRQDGVNGRVAAYQMAAQRSRTPWFFAVFAKLRVSQTFDWTWQPDLLQQPKHYIFHARNPVNGLEYGHQAMIAYNRRMTLENTGQGLDFTLDQPHEVVPVVSGVACYDETPWMAWRTAFREVIKLRHSLPDVESEYRINRWCANGQGEFAQWSSVGAQDALEYYDEVGGDFDQLKKSYEWSWLASYALIKRNLSPDQ